MSEIKKIVVTMILAALIIIMIVIMVIVISATKAQAFELSIEKTLRFGAGVASSIGLHEAGHWLMLESLDRDYKFYLDGINPKYTYRGESRNIIQMSGLMANALSSEIVLQAPKEKRGAYLNGILVGNILEEIFYPTLRYNSGDFKYMHGREKALFAAFSITHGLFTTWRVYKAGHLNVKTWLGTSRKGTPMLGFHVRW